MTAWSSKRTTLIALKIAFSIGLIAFLLWRIPFARVAGALGAADPRWLGAAAAVMLASNLLGTYQWWRLLRVANIRLPLWKTCAYYHVGLFFNNFLPANIGGDIARVADSSRHGGTTGAAVSAVVMDRLIGTVALAGVALVTTFPAVDRFHLLLAYLCLVGFFALSVALLWGLFHPRLLPAMERVLARVGLGRLSPHLDELALRLEAYRGARALLARMLVVAAITQLARIGVHALVARALGLRVPFQYFLLFVPLLAVIVSFGLIGVDRARAFSLQFLTYLVAVTVSLLGGLAYLIRIPQRRAAARSLGRDAG
ncbi:MAG: flippase-like domain-containing protein [Candidatus Eisenbacteria bacterium]|uniref:Flippase-like domain-containing protein n=1 Tax=Eiseniibacteriota bacterium TaxID=2212470 RepID=A0A538U1C7_UNCEI|nr:MAG: flippase-like domain-containing protein [Candidatus Eisenbacteria bacterium]